MNSKSVLWIIPKILSIRIYPFFLLQLLFFYNGVLQAQWVQNNGPYVSSDILLAVSGDNIYAGAQISGVYLSTDGMNWTSAGLVNNFYGALAVNGNKIFAGSDWNGVYLSTNNGINWNYTGLKDGLIYAIADRKSVV